MEKDNNKESFKRKSLLGASMKNKGVLLVVVLVIIVVIALLVYFDSSKQSDAIKIGVITDLTGPAAYWGESSRIGAELAVEDLRKEGYDIELLFEDYQLDATKALNGAQKLVNVDNVDGIYAEFNPAAISVGSFVSDKNILFVYDAAVTSPLEESQLTYKTYLDYQEGCKQVAKKFKDRGISKIGVLKINLEAGELCLKGVKEVYGENIFVESYNLGEQDFKTQLLKLNNNKIDAVINVGFEGDTLNALKVLKEQGLNIKYGTVDDTITQQVIDSYGDELVGGYSFGFSEVNPEFKNRLAQYNLATDCGAAITYTHIKQMTKAISDCKGDKECIIAEMNDSPADDTIGFKMFSDRIAALDMEIKSY